VRAAIAGAGAQVVAARRNVGVIAFGSDGEVRKAFHHYNVQSWDVHAIEISRLRYESQEHGLLYDALTTALERERPVVAKRRRTGHIVIVDQTQQTHELLTPLRSAVGALTGTVPRTTVGWAEAAQLRLDFKLDRLWLLVEPRLWVEGTDNEGESAAAREFRRERLARRYNSTWNTILEAWVHMIVGAAEEGELRAFGIGDGIDASFRIGKITAFSWRERA